MAYTGKTLGSQTNPHADWSIFQGGNSVRCHRCGGLMAREFCFDLQDETGKTGFWAARCLQCGELLDPLILQNRYAQDPTVLKDRARRKEIIATSNS
jgi:hypothetical protein